MDHVITIITGLVLSFAAAFVTVHLSLRRFRAERLWLRRVDAYQTVLEALHRVSRGLMVELARQTRPDFMAKHKPSEDENRNIQEAYAEISKAKDLGSFLLSDDATTCLENLETSMDKTIKMHPESYVGYLIDVQGDLDDCLKELRGIAKADIKKLRI